MKDAYYFPHDSNARNDQKILAMRTIYGTEGYGWFFMLIEILREQETYRLPVNKYTFEILAKELGAQAPAIQKFIEDCITEFADNSGALLYSDGQFIWSESLLRRMGIIDGRREVARSKALKRWHTEIALLPKKSSSIAVALPQQCNGNASKVKKSKVNNKFNYIDIEDIKKCPSNATASEVWEKVKERLQLEVNPSNYRTWLEKTVGLVSEDGFFYVGCPSTFVAEYLTNNQKSIAENALCKVTGQKLDIRFIVAKEETEVVDADTR